MHARIILGKILLEKRDEAIAIYTQSIAPAAQAQPGFSGGHLLTDSDTGKFIATSFWESEEAMIASEKNAYFQEQIDKISPCFAGPLIIQHYEVTARSE